MVVSLLMRLNVVECERLHGRADRSKLVGLFESPIVVPLVHDRAFDHPHGRSTISARAMDERGLITRSSNDLQKLIDNSWIRHLGVQRNVNEVDARGLCSCRFTFDVGTLFGC